MIGLLLGFIGTFFEEINSSFSKHKTNKHHFLSIGVISTFFSTFMFSIVGVYKYYFTNTTLYLNLESIPFLGLRIILEVLQSYFTIVAIKHCDRSTFSIIRILTIPFLLLVDIFLGYSFTIYSFLGIGIILLSFLFTSIKGKTFSWQGRGFALFTALNAVITITLFKYSISRYGNSVEVDQFIMFLSIFIFFIIYNYKKNKKCALSLIGKEKEFLLQGVSIGLSTLLLSYMFLYLNASEATAIKRAGEMFWSIVVGFIYFKEKNIMKKLLFAFVLGCGLVIMIYK